MFKMSAFSFAARRESFVEAQNGFADCFIRQIVPASYTAVLDPILWFWFRLTKTY